MLMVLLFAAAMLQWRAGAFTGALTGDASAHYVSGLMVHDWLLNQFGSNPVRYLINYHAHLPLTAIGLWPPFYYGIEAIWMLLLGVGKPAMLWLSGSTTALLGLAVGTVVARRAGWIGGVLAGLVLLGNPLVQRASNELMLDVAAALGCFLAALAYAAYLARGRWGTALGFGLLAVIAMMTKYNALALAFLPSLCVLIGRRWDLLRRPSFYAPGVIVGVLAGPWYMLGHGLAEQGSNSHFDICVSNIG
jgi:4-amino-4-deoxy-L-arabinose transferase-like glycosyltransferase